MSFVAILCKSAISVTSEFRELKLSEEENSEITGSSELIYNVFDMPSFGGKGVFYPKLETIKNNLPSRVTKS